jgi:hypothetical protein
MKEKKFQAKITDSVFISKLAYLSDFFGEMNIINFSFLGKYILTARDKVASFLHKLQFY